MQQKNKYLSVKGKNVGASEVMKLEKMNTMQCNSHSAVSLSASNVTFQNIRRDDSTIEHLNMKYQNEMQALQNELQKHKQLIAPIIREKHSRIRYSPQFMILPDYKIEKSIQYPDTVTLKNYGAIQLNPLKLGAHYFCILARFGVQDVLKTGFENDRKKTVI